MRDQKHARLCRTGLSSNGAVQDVRVRTGVATSSPRRGCGSSAASSHLPDDVEPAGRVHHERLGVPFGVRLRHDAKSACGRLEERPESQGGGPVPLSERSSTPPTDRLHKHAPPVRGGPDPGAPASPHMCSMRAPSAAPARPTCPSPIASDSRMALQSATSTMRPAGCSCGTRRSNMNVQTHAMWRTKSSRTSPASLRARGSAVSDASCSMARGRGGRRGVRL
jgi:hypothetical protein